MPICCISFDSYIKPQHDQKLKELADRCISFDSYIKPQPLLGGCSILCVVYLLIPTSNHNHDTETSFSLPLYIF